MNYRKSSAESSVDLDKARKEPTSVVVTKDGAYDPRAETCLDLRSILFVDIEARQTGPTQPNLKYWKCCILTCPLKAAPQILTHPKLPLTVLHV